jgi:hypothetical protein
MMRRDAFATRFTALLVMATPLVLLAIGYSQGSASHTPHAVTEFIFLLAMTTLTTGVLGYVTRETLGEAGGSGEQLLELIERARTAEARATFAEQQLAGAGYGSFAVQSPVLGSDDDALARMRGGSSSPVVLYAAILFLICSLATGYFAAYAPLQDRVDAQRKVAQTKDEQSAAAMKSLRSSFDSERSELQAQLRAAQARVDMAVAAAPVAVAVPEAPAAPAVAPEAKKIEPKRVETKKVEAKKVETKKVEPAPARVVESPAPAKAKVVATHAARPARIKKISARTAAAKPAAKAGAPAAAAKNAHYDDESLDDDPIGGL